MEVKETIIKTLKSAGKPLKAGEIAESCGIGKKEIDKGIKSMVKEGKLQSPKRCFYDLV